MAKRVLSGFDLPSEGDIIDQVAEAQTKKEKRKPRLGEVSLDVVAGHYHKRAYKNRETFTYLEKRGITDTRLVDRFRIGYADGSILALTGNGQHQALVEAGIIEGDREVFAGCVVFPLLDMTGKVAALYGRDASGTGEVLFRGNADLFFNLRALAVYEEIILTESIVEALSFIQLGFANTAALPRGLAESHIEAMADARVKTVILAACGDADALRDRLVEAGFVVKVALPPRGKNWAEWLVGGRSREEADSSIAAAEVYGEAEETIKAKRKGSVWWFSGSKVTYRVVGVKDHFVSSLKVNVKAECGPECFYDTLDLYSSRSRESYASKLAYIADLEAGRIEKDLVAILEHLETERDRKAGPETGEEITAALTAEEREAGRAFLESSDMFDQIAADMTALGYVNETANKLIVYIASMSRFLANPLSVYIQAGASGGKSALLSTLEKLILPSDIWKATTISPQAFNYVDQERLIGKVFFMGESIHDEAIEALVRQMQSEGEISRLVTMKDEKTGEMKAHLVRRTVKMSFMVTSTALSLNPENASRCLIISADESSEQTGKVLDQLGYNHGFEGKVAGEERAGRIAVKHHAAQRLLEPVSVYNPYWQHIGFPKSRPSMRRAYEQFLTMIDTICFLRQAQKPDEVMRNPETGHDAAVKACDLTDYRIAYELFTAGVLARAGTDIPAGTRQLYEAIREMVRERSRDEGVKPVEVSFIQKQIREATQMGHEFVKKHLRFLASFEYVEVTGGRRHGTRYAYRLREDKPVEEMDVSMITTPDELERLLEEENG